MCSYKSIFFIVFIGSNVLAMENDSTIEDAIKGFGRLNFGTSNLKNFTIINKAEFSAQIFLKTQTIPDKGEILSSVGFTLAPCASDCLVLENSSEKIEAELVIGAAKKSIQIDDNATCRISKCKTKIRDGKKQRVNDIRVELTRAGDSYDHFFKVIRTRKNY